MSVFWALVLLLLVVSVDVRAALYNFLNGLEPVVLIFLFLFAWVWYSKS